MTVSDPLRPAALLLDLPARTRAEVLDAVAVRAAEITGREAREIARALADREALGSTGVGSGVALPHATIAGLGAPLALFVRLARPLDWEAIDDRPVDLVVAVLSPDRPPSPSPSLLSRCARLLRDEANRRRLRSGGEAEVVHALTEGGIGSRGAD
jgi:PTS system nitrogen regulatory IIA component